MNRFSIALFDLDGTLSESGEGILYCVRRIFAETGRPLPDEQTLGTFIGPPMYDSLRRCGFSHDEAEAGVEIYKRNFIEKGIAMQQVYPGIPALLQALKRQGVRLGVATTKYEPFAHRIMRQLSLEPYFDFVGGATAGTERRTKAGVIEYTLRGMLAGKNDSVVMIGDTKYDAEGAALTGVDFIGCLYGYGTREEMARFCPQAAFVDSPEAIAPLLTGAEPLE